jgi:large subunit ribosomal protein L16
MQYTPKKTKYKKLRKGRLLNVVSKPLLINNLTYGCVALKALDSGRITSAHLLCCKQTINKVIKKNGQLRFNIFPHTPITSKPLEIRMGKGKGSVDHWVANVFSGTILMEIESSSSVLAIKALKYVQNKLPINTQITIERN